MQFEPAKINRDKVDSESLNQSKPCWDALLIRYLAKRFTSQAHFTAGDVIISSAAAPKFLSCALCTWFHWPSRGELDVLFDRFHSLCLPLWHTFFTHKAAFWSDNTLARSTLKKVWRNQGIFSEMLLSCFSWNILNSK